MTTEPKEDAGFWADLVSIFGYVLGVSYPVLALSTSVRGLYQAFFKEGITNYTPVVLTVVAALCYLLTSSGFLYRKKWAWRLSFFMLAVETFLAVVVGTLSLIIPQTIGHTVWANFGLDYGFFPFLQPLLGIAWLTWKQTLKEYGLPENWRAAFKQS